MATTTITAERNNLNERYQYASLTGDGNDTVIKVGFSPVYVKVINETDAIIWEKTKGMAAANSIKLNGTGPAITKDTNSAILFNSDNSITLATATAAPNAKAITVIIQG